MLKNNKYKYIFFDLDGTLLNLDTDELVSKYFKTLNEFFIKNGYDSKKVVAGIQSGIYAMIKNDGSISNEEALTNAFMQAYPCDLDEFKTLMGRYYFEEFDKIKSIITFKKETNLMIKKLKDNGYKLILATNPLFPKIATYKRTLWAGLSPEDFEIITTYEKEYFAKPNIKYYESILNRINVNPQDCIMVGNDAEEDMCAEKVGLDVFLITTNLLNRKNKDISNYKQGTLKDFENFIFKN